MEYLRYIYKKYLLFFCNLNLTERPVYYLAILDRGGPQHLSISRVPHPQTMST